MSQTKPITKQVEDAVKDIPGWSPIDQLLTLFTLAYSSTHLGGDILEIGSWCGRSAVTLGMAVKLSGKGKVHCIDLFPEKSDWFENEDGTYSFEVNIEGRLVGAYRKQRVWVEPYERDITPVYEQFGGILEAFTTSISNNGLSNFVSPVKGDLISFLKNAPESLKVRLAFIDGDHSYEAVSNDITLIESVLIHGGWICFDDAFSSYSGVNDAIQKHIIDSGKYEYCQQMTRKLFVARRR